MGLWTRSRDVPARDLKALRAEINARFVQFGPMPEGLETAPGRFGTVRGAWFRPQGVRTARVILYFHGGGYVAGSPESHRALTGRLALAAGSHLFSADYRLAPDCDFPDAVRDGVEAWRGLLDAGIPPAAMVMGGDEAGGGLAFAAGLAIRNAGLPMPAGIFALSPWADISLSGWSVLANRREDAVQHWDLLFRCARHYLGRTSPADPYASPVFADFRGFPPVMVHAGAAEILRDDASRLGDCATAAGVPLSVEIYDGMGHLFQAERRPEAQASLARLGQFVRARTGLP